MIQRIQSVYLLLTALLSSLFLKGNILTFKKDSGTDIVMNIKEAYQLTETGNIGLIQNQIPALIILVTVMLLSLIAIFFYRKRKLQMKLTMGVLLLTFAFIAVVIFYSVSVIDKYQVVPVLGYKMFIPLLMILFGILAFRGIRKDEELVNSYDRLR
jgi:hypothetical protein